MFSLDPISSVTRFQINGPIMNVQLFFNYQIMPTTNRIFQDFFASPFEAFNKTLIIIQHSLYTSSKLIIILKTSSPVPERN